MSGNASVVWLSPRGDVIACIEKNKVMHENLAEIRQVCQDALEDAVLMGCDEQHFARYWPSWLPRWKAFSRLRISDLRLSQHRDTPPLKSATIRATI
ncbi:MAG: hypothetical protein U1C96_06185 [Gallionella sp.]|nr:hypothetical protein [Gallionella sp.]